MLIINLKGSLTVTPDLENTTVIEKEFNEAQSILHSNALEDDKIVISGAGDMAYAALQLAFEFNKDAYINGEMLDVVKNKKSTMSEFERDLLLLKMCVDKDMLQSAQLPVIDRLVKSCPARLSKESAIQYLRDYAPSIKGAAKQMKKRFEQRLEERKQANKERLFIDEDGEKTIKVKMSISEAYKYIIANEGLFVINWAMGAGKSEEVTRKLYEMASEELRILLMTSSITLTNAFCPETDPSNYKKALLANSEDRKKLNRLASTMNSALLNEAFRNTRETADIAIFEEYEACRDVVTSRIMGDGSLSDRARAQRELNKLLNKKRVVFVDAHFSKQSADHISKRTGRPIVVIEPTDFDAKNKLPTISYNTSRSETIEWTSLAISREKEVAAYCDGKHTGDQSIVRATQIQIENVTKEFGKDIESLLVDAEFFTREDNKKYLSEITKLYEENDLVISTPATKNGCSSLAPCDNVTLLMHQTMSPLDVLQTSRRNRLAKTINLNIAPSSRSYHTSKPYLFETELVVNIKKEDVNKKRDELINDPAAQDIIDRIAYNNEMRDQYENNTLDMFELLGYEIEFTYGTSRHEAEKEARKQEQLEAFNDYKMLDSIKKMAKVAEIREKDEEVRGLQEKRVLYAHEVFSFYHIDPEHPDFEDVIKYDSGRAGQKFINNLKLVRYGIDSDYYEAAAREIIFTKMFEMINIDVFTLKGNFSKQHCEAFKEWYMTAEVALQDGSTLPVINMMKTFVNKDAHKKGGSWIVRNILREHFGVAPVVAKELKEGNKTETEVVIKNATNNRRERAYCISEASSEQINKMYRLAYPGSAERPSEATVWVDEQLNKLEADLKAKAEQCLFELQDTESDEDFDAHVIAPDEVHQYI